MPLPFDDIYLITPKLSRAHPDDIDALEDWLGAPLPAGYRHFVSTLGAGTYCGRLMVWMPAQIRADCETERAFVREYFDDFWGEDPVIPMTQAAQGIPFASTVDGDKLFYCTTEKRLFVLPRHGDQVLWMPQGLDAPLDWGQPAAHDGPIYFDSHIDRAIVEHFSSAGDSLHTTVTDVAARIARHFTPAHRLDAAWGTRLFLPAIHGTAQLTQAPGDTRVGVRLEFDASAAVGMRALWSELAALGFRETGRWPATPNL